MNNTIDKHIQQILKTIEELLVSRDYIIIGIDGKSGAGKTTLSNRLGSLCHSNIFHMDDFFLRPGQKTEERLKEVGGNVDYERFKREVIDGIISKNDFTYQIYDCKLMALTDFIKVEPKRINIIEGSYSMHPTLIEKYDYKIFLDIDYETQKDRILKRNGPSAFERFINEWIPKENTYFNEMKIKEKCDLVINAK